jgi:hypothetical protein
METVLNDTFYGLLTWQIIILVSIGLWIYSLIDILKSSFEKNNKIIWILVVLLVPILGSVLYIFIGRKQKLKLN